LGNGIQIERTEIQAQRNEIQIRRNEIQAQRNEIQIQRDGIQIPGVQTFQWVKVGIGLAALEIVDNFARLPCSVSRSPFTTRRRPAPDQAS
jgi:hypothetical protein